MIPHAVSTSNLPSKTLETLSTRFILAQNHQQCISNDVELEREPGTKHCESNASTMTLVGLILNGSSETT